jgi:hypothetical protein
VLGKRPTAVGFHRIRGFCILNFDQLLQGHGAPAHLALIDRLQQSRQDFIARLLEREQSTVIDWGFPPSNLAIVRELQEGGVVVWWFDGDREAARQSFVDRGDVSIDDFQRQMKNIETSWLQIKELTGNHVINAVGAGPMHAASDRIFEEMFGSGQSK